MYCNLSFLEDLWHLSWYDLKIIKDAHLGGAKGAYAPKLFLLRPVLEDKSAPRARLKRLAQSRNFCSEQR